MQDQEKDKTGKAVGHRVWIIPDGYLPEKSSGDLISHESVCVLNTGDRDALIKIMVYFEDMEPMDGFYATCAARRTNHIRMEKIRDKDGNSIPRGIPYALKVESSEPVVVQCSRLDSTQPEMALMTTMGYPVF
jgi:hypothetical protein